MADPTPIKTGDTGSSSSELGRQLAGKHMTFKLDREEYGLAITRVREIIGLMDITRVPRTKEFIRGVINLRGKVIPVVALRRKFNMPVIKATDQTVKASSPRVLTSTDTRATSAKSCREQMKRSTPSSAH